MYHIKIKGKSYPVKYGHSVCLKHMKKAGIKVYAELGFLPQKLKSEDIPEFVHDGFATGAKLTKSDVPFTLAEVKELLESDYWIVPEIFEAFGKSLMKPKNADDNDADEVKSEEEKN